MGKPPAVSIEVVASLYALPLQSNVRRFDHEALARYARATLGPGFTIDALAAHLELAPRFVSYLLHGHRQPSLHTYAHLLAHAQLPVGSLMRGLSLHPHHGEPLSG